MRGANRVGLLTASAARRLLAHSTIRFLVCWHCLRPMKRHWNRAISRLRKKPWTWLSLGMAILKAAVFLIGPAMLRPWVAWMCGENLFRIRRRPVLIPD